MVTFQISLGTQAEAIEILEKIAHGDFSDANAVVLEYLAKSTRYSRAAIYLLVNNVDVINIPAEEILSNLQVAMKFKKLLAERIGTLQSYAEDAIFSVKLELEMAYMSERVSCLNLNDAHELQKFLSKGSLPSASDIPSDTELLLARALKILYMVSFAQGHTIDVIIARRYPDGQYHSFPYNSYWRFDKSFQPTIYANNDILLAVEKLEREAQEAVEKKFGEPYGYGHNFYDLCITVH